MMMQLYWVRNIQVRCFSVALAALFCSLPALSLPCDETARGWRKATSKTGLAACAAGDNATSQLAMGVAAIEGAQFNDAVRYGRLAGQKLSKVRDYAAWIEASGQFGLKNYKAAIDALKPVWIVPYATPLTGKAAIIAARSLDENGESQNALALLRQFNLVLPQPAGEMLTASLLAKTGDTRAAAASYQRVYFDYPTSPEAAQASAFLRILSSQMGPKYPAPAASSFLDRIAKLLPASPGLARQDILIAGALLTNAEKELMRVRQGAADYFSRAHERSLAYLRVLKVSSAPADAERLYYISGAARKLNREEEMQHAVDELNRSHSTSKWRMEALVDAGYYYLRENRYNEYEPIYAACADSFPAEPKAAFCHWKVVWSSYLRHRNDANTLLGDHLEKFPGSEKANAALYFLGRAEERRGDPGSAKALYQKAWDQFPNTYYALESHRRLADVKIAQAIPPAKTVEWLSGLRFPDKKSQIALQASPQAKWAMERGLVLESAGLTEFSELELRALVRKEGQSVPVAMFLAEMMQRQGLIDKGIRHIKGSVPGYLNLSMQETGETFWRLAFPIPFSEPLLRFCAKHEIDPFLMAGLIRQESEFNPTVISHAKAYGLTQVLPSTGRELSIKAGIRGFFPAMLFQPEINLNLGTLYIRQMLNSLENSVVETLAAYNAGRSRVIKWRTFGTFREPSEFIETVPFDETRDYIQSVIRNGEMYRQLYSKEKTQLMAKKEPLPAPLPVAAKKTTATAKATPKKNAKSKVQKRKNS